MKTEVVVSIPPHAGGMRLLDWLVQNGFLINADCGGRGTCGKCSVRVLDGAFLSDDAGGGYKQCNNPLRKESMEVTSTEDPSSEVTSDKQEYVLACRVLCPKEGATIAFPRIEGDGLSIHRSVVEETDPHSPSSPTSGYGFALDIGTTTLASALVDRRSGQTVATFSCLNPQKSFGADVISRIYACRQGNLEQLTQVLRRTVTSLLEQSAARFPQKLPEVLSVVGNPTMLHLFCGISPEGMGAYPFTPMFLETKRFSGQLINLPIGEVVVSPSISAFLGGDVLGGVFASRMTERQKPSVLLDIGTNGEMIFCSGTKNRNDLVGISTAAGPALEGANISCGMGGIAGAINSVTRYDNENGQPVIGFTTVGDQPPLGFCGSGLIDLIAVLLDLGIVDETGYLESNEFLFGSWEGINFEQVMHGKPSSNWDGKEKLLRLTQKDIREFQLAKSAIRAGFQTLMRHVGCIGDDLEAVFLAGGLGFYLNPDSALRIGLLPANAAGKMMAIGNSALTGAKALLCDDQVLHKLQSLAAACETYELNADPYFAEAFMDYMMFPDGTTKALSDTKE